MLLPAGKICCDQLPPQVWEKILVFLKGLIRCLVRVHILGIIVKTAFASHVLGLRSEGPLLGRYIVDLQKPVRACKAVQITLRKDVVFPVSACSGMSHYASHILIEPLIHGTWKHLP